MLRAYALVYAILVALMIAFFSSSVLLLMYLNNKVSNLDNQHLYKQQLLNDGMSLFLEINYLYPYDKEISYNLYNEEKSKVYFIKKQFGLYDILIVKLENESKKYKTAIVGKKPIGILTDALYLSDNFKPLVLTGTTKIRGDILIPENGIQQGYMDGIPYYNKELFIGKQTNSNNNLPSIQIDRINKMYDMQIKKTVNKFGNDSVKNSFIDNPKVYYFDNQVVLQNIVLRNNCMILSKQKIRIKNNTHLETCIIIAPSIEVENGTVGSMQLFATDTIWLGENVQLNYPSVVCVNGNNQQNFLRISKNAKVCGEVYSICPLQFRTGYLPHFEIEKDAKIIGMCYTEGNSKINGTIFGTLLVNLFVYNSPQSIYVNYLHNAVIDVTARNSNFLFSSVTMQTEKKSTVIQWVD